jgi:hypothetical protein
MLYDILICKRHFLYSVAFPSVYGFCVENIENSPFNRYDFFVEIVHLGYLFKKI